MRHARKDYDRIQDPAKLIPEEEPVFVIRGQDVVGPFVLKVWAVANWLAGGSQKASKLVWNWAGEMKRWPQKKACDLFAENGRCE